MRRVQDLSDETTFVHFAYKSDDDPTPLQVQRLTHSVTPATSHRAVPASNRLPDSQLAQLSKCVACGLQWTARKTAKEKRTHVEQCARKNGLTKGTVWTLVEKELGPQENAIVTLMDSVVSRGPAKKTKRQQVVSTLRSLPETRESILNRARDILGPTNGDANPQPTQQFTRSKLACQKSKNPTLLDAEEPPSTQPFGASSLCRAVVATRSNLGDCEESSFPRTQQFGASVFARDLRKRPASLSPPPDNETRSVRRRCF